MAKYSNFMTAAIHLSEWLAEHNIDPDAVEITLKPRDWGIKGAIDAALRMEVEEMRSTMIPVTPVRRDEIEVAGLTIKIPAPPSPEGK